MLISIYLWIITNNFSYILINLNYLQAQSNTPGNPTDPLSDLNTFYNIGFNSRNLLIGGEDSINNSILNLLSIIPGELLFEPEFGSYIQRYLFDPVDALTASSIKEWTIQAIKRWLPHLILDINKSVVIPNSDNQSYTVLIYYTILGNEGQTFFQTGLSAF